MNTCIGRVSFRRFSLAASSVVALVPLAGAPVERRAAETPYIGLEYTRCSAEQRREALKTMQTEVLRSVPAELPSLGKALEPDGALAGWRLSHGYVVLATAGAVAVDNIAAKDPIPQLLLYAPSRSSKPADWLDFDGPDDPYRLAGWAYIGPYTPGSQPPGRRCVAPGEWVVHEAGWHLKDGNMHLTPGATNEPPRPPRLAIHMWHPQVWDLHVWRGDDGIATIDFANPHERPGGLELPDGSFFREADGRRRPVHASPGLRHRHE
jgi:hypothetical protein